MTVEDHPPRLTPADDPQGSWRNIRLIDHATRPPTLGPTSLYRVVRYSVDEITTNQGLVIPKTVDLRSLEGVLSIGVTNPQYVSTPQLRFATLDLSYYAGTVLLASLKLPEEYPMDEDELADIRAIRSDIQRRLDTDTLWQPEDWLVEGIGRVEWRVIAAGDEVRRGACERE